MDFFVEILCFFYIKMSMHVRRIHHSMVLSEVGQRPVSDVSISTPQSTIQLFYFFPFQYQKKKDK